MGTESNRFWKIAAVTVLSIASASLVFAANLDSLPVQKFGPLHTSSGVSLVVSLWISYSYITSDVDQLAPESSTNRGTIAVLILLTANLYSVLYLLQRRNMLKRNSSTDLENGPFELIRSPDRKVDLDSDEAPSSDTEITSESAQSGIAHRSSPSHSAVDANHVVDATVAVFPESADEFSNVGGTKILEQVDQSFHGRGPNTETYRYVNQRTVTFGDDAIEIGNGSSSATLDYDDIIDTDLLRGKTIVDSSLRLMETDYLRLTVAKFACPHCGEFTGFADDVRAHVEASNDDEHDGEAEIDSGDRELIYVYLVGGHQGRVERTYSSDLDVEHEFEEMPEPGGTAFGKARQELQRRCTNTKSDLYVLTDWIERPGRLRIQGVQEGGSRVTGGIAGRTSSSGVTRGTQVGPFSRGTSKSQGSISASLEGRIEDNTFSSDIDFFQVDELGLYVESDPVLDIPYAEVDRVLERDDGLLLEIGETTYSLTGKGYLTETRPFDRENVSEVVGYIAEQAGAAREKATAAQDHSSGQTESDGDGSSQTSAEKLRDLQELHDEGVLSDDEFAAKKEELLEEF